VGALHSGLSVESVPDSIKAQVGKTGVYEGKVVADPDLRETTQRVTVAMLDTKVLVVAPLYPEITYGERVRIQGKLSLPEPFDATGGRTFQYDKFLLKDGIVALVNNAHITSIEEPTGINAGIAWVFSVRHSFLEALSQALPEPYSALAGGLLAGGKQGLGESLLAAFILSGLVHIVVLSGYNVMIVAEAVLRLFSFLPRRVGATVALLVIGLFVLAAGAGAASIRAGIMAALALVARATRRTYAVIRALCAAAFVMLLLNPQLLIFDPGFQLSFVATFGLIVGAPLISQRLSVVKSEFVRELLASTIAAQLAVLPLLLYQTGLLSLVSLPANLLVLPVVPLAMLFSAVAGVVGFFGGNLAVLFGLPAYGLLAYIIGVAEFVANLPLATVSLPAFPFWLVFVAYVALGAGVYWISRKDSKAVPY